MINNQEVWKKMKEVKNKRIALILAVLITVLFVPTASYAADEADDIKYSTDEGEEVDFKKKDFNNVCEDLNDETLDYVKFDLPSSSKGVLWYDYDGDDEERVDDSDKYYYDNDDEQLIEDVTFVPKSGYSGTVTISYEGTDKDSNDFSGEIKITVKDDDDDDDSDSGDIKFSGDADDEIEFDEDKFNDYCEDENNETLDYVTFELPASSKGILWYDYDGDDEVKVKEDVKYYYDKDPSIDDITFIPDEDYAGNCKIEFEGIDEDGDDIDGTVVIAVNNEDLVANTIYLSGAAGSPVIMFDEYFNKKCKDVLGNTLDYVKFSLPGSSSGTLYYNYTSANNYTSLVSASTKYYYDDDSPDLKKVSFVSAGSSAGTYTIKYTGYDEDGGSFTGEVNITVTAGTGTPGSGSSSVYFSDVNGNYSWAVKYVDTLYSTSVITGGTSSGGPNKFNPGTAITRGDFMLYLVKALNLYSGSASGNFSDVAAGSYYYDAIATAKALGIAQGSSNKFYPNSTITREDAMVLALRAMNLSGHSVASGSTSDLYSYADNGSVSSYAKEAVATLIKNGVVTGSSDGKIYPKSTISRAESAAVIYRIVY